MFGHAALVLHNKMEIPLEIKLKSPETDKEKQEGLSSVKLPHLYLHSCPPSPDLMEHWS